MRVQATTNLRPPCHVNAPRHPRSCQSTTGAVSRLGKSGASPNSGLFVGRGCPFKRMPQGSTRFRDGLCPKRRSRHLEVVQSSYDTDMTRVDYDETRYRRWALPHPLLLHWVLNPGLAVNELLLGQRIPKLSLVDKTSTRPLMGRTFVPCPECGALHDGRLWSRGAALGHWFGLVCPDCGKVIPCLWNVTSLVLLVLTFPVWIVPTLLWRERWLAFELQRVRAVREKGFPEHRSVAWMRVGVLGFGGSMWLVMAVLPAVREGLLAGRASWRLVLWELPVWLLAGLIFGALMRWWTGRSGRVPQGR
jgi:hypothetical protein